VPEPVVDGVHPCGLNRAEEEAREVIPTIQNR
jgi:hypothetical protein